MAVPSASGSGTVGAADCGSSVGSSDVSSAGIGVGGQVRHVGRLGLHFAGRFEFALGFDVGRHLTWSRCAFDLIVDAGRERSGGRQRRAGKDSDGKSGLDPQGHERTIRQVAFESLRPTPRALRVEAQPVVIVRPDEMRTQ